VQVISGATGATLASFFAYDPGATVGMRVAVVDLDGDGKAEIVTAPGAGGAPHVRAFRVAGDGTVAEVAGFFAYDAGFLGGVFVAGVP
jgi:serralysin